jgi:hypothetical protein
MTRDDARGKVNAPELRNRAPWRTKLDLVSPSCLIRSFLHLPFTSFSQFETVIAKFVEIWTVSQISSL